MAAAGSVVDPVDAYQQWQVAVARRAEASGSMNASGVVAGVDREAATPASADPTPETRSDATEATLEAWELLRSERVDWIGARDRFATLSTDATLSHEQRHEARLGFVLAAVMSGEHRAAAMAARRVDVRAGMVALDADVASHLETAREAMGSIGAGDREALFRVLGMLGAPTPGGAALHAARTDAEGRQS